MTSRSNVVLGPSIGDGREASRLARGLARRFLGSAPTGERTRPVCPCPAEPTQLAPPTSPTEQMRGSRTALGQPSGQPPAYGRPMPPATSTEKHLSVPPPPSPSGASEIESALKAAGGPVGLYHRPKSHHRARRTDDLPAPVASMNPALKVTKPNGASCSPVRSLSPRSSPATRDEHRP